MDDINRPDFYVGTPASVTELYHENGMLESGDGQHLGEKELWGFIHRIHKNKLN